MTEMGQTYRQVAVGETVPNAVTVGIETDADGALKAAVWWDAVGDVDADEAEYDDVAMALAAAEGARALHGFSEVVVTLQEGVTWRPQWGVLGGDAALTDAESYQLAAGIEAERDA